MYETPAEAGVSSMKENAGQRETLPAFRHPVHTLSRFGVPLMTARTR